MAATRTLRLAGLSLLTALSLDGAALAEPATATAWLNVRSGPGGSYSVVDTLAPGEEVEITECQTNGWCYVDHVGTDGWVSSSYLTTTPGAPSAGSDCRISITLGPEGPRFAFICGDDDGPTPPPPPLPSGTKACFYTGTNYGGNSFCSGVGIRNSLNETFRNRISSVRVFGGAKARLCDQSNLGQFCRNVTSNVAVLGPQINNKASSVAVYTGSWTGSDLPPPPAPPPATLSTGLLEIPGTWTANLDNGTVGGGGADIWYRVDTPTVRFLAPTNGGRLALGNGSNRGYEGCSVAAFSTAAIPKASLPLGTYVCVRTNAGRISQVRVNSFAGGALRLGYTTWQH